MRVKVTIEADIQSREGEPVHEVAWRVRQLLDHGTVKDAFSDADIDLNRIQVVVAKEVLP